MEHRMQQQSGWRGDPRVVATWVGATIVLACGMWLYWRGGTPARPRGVSPASGSIELVQELLWIDQRLAREREDGPADEPQTACRVASLHWDRASRLAQHEYYRLYGTSWLEDQEQEYSAFRSEYLRRDQSGDVAATLQAARHALKIGPPGAGRARALWLLSLACGVAERREEQIGALVELTRYKVQQPWVWRLLAHAFRGRGDAARLELAEEQAWRAEDGRPLSAYITRVLRHTPYARPAPQSLASQLPK
jgi:hypothetical protein